MAVQAHLAAFEEVGDGCDGFAAVPGRTAHGEDEVTEAVAGPGCFLEVVPLERIVMTSLLTGGWRPATPWLAMTAIISMADEGLGTRYGARVLHKDSADSDRHKNMGFFDGWNTCITQLEELAQKIA